MTQIKTQELPAGIGVEIVDLDLREPLPPDAVSEMSHLLHERGLLVFRGQDLDADTQRRFAANFGPFANRGIDRPDRAFDFSSRQKGTFGDAEFDFHADGMWTQFPIGAIQLYGIEVASSGGETVFAATDLVLDRLPADAVADLRSCRACMLIDYPEALKADVANLPRTEEDIRYERPFAAAIERHPVTGREYVTPFNMSQREMIGVSRERAQELYDLLFAALYDDAHVYSHVWKPGDLLFWDNVLRQHKRAPWDMREPRTLRRVALANYADLAASEASAKLASVS